MQITLCQGHGECAWARRGAHPASGRRKVKGQGWLTHNLETDRSGTGGVLENLNTASGLKSPRTRPFTAPEFCSNSQQGVEGGGFFLACSPYWDPLGCCCRWLNSLLPWGALAQALLPTSGWPALPMPLGGGGSNCPGNVSGGRAGNCGLQEIPGGTGESLQRGEGGAVGTRGSRGRFWLS